MLTNPVFAGFTPPSAGPPTWPVLSGAGRPLDGFWLIEGDSSGRRELSAGVGPGAAVVVGAGAEETGAASPGLFEGAVVFELLALAANKSKDKKRRWLVGKNG